jgi:hypothetical protein
MEYQAVSTIVRLGGKEVKVHGLCTGTVAVKRNFRKKNGMGELAKINILLDKYWSCLHTFSWIIRMD